MTAVPEPSDARTRIEDPALIEAIARAIRSHRVEVFTETYFDDLGWQCLTCGEERKPFTTSIEMAEQDGLSHSARAAYAAMVEYLGLTWQPVGLNAPFAGEPKRWRRRLVSKWEEVTS